mgnify:CR=1 FL=1
MASTGITGGAMIMKPLARLLMMSAISSGALLLSACSTSGVEYRTVHYGVYDDYGYPYYGYGGYYYYDDDDHHHKHDDDDHDHERPDRPDRPHRPDRPTRPDRPGVQPVTRPGGGMSRPVGGMGRPSGFGGGRGGGGRGGGRGGR